MTTHADVGRLEDVERIADGTLGRFGPPMSSGVVGSAEYETADPRD